jgi:hypothetical protein
MIKKKKYDGVVVAAHFSADGKIDWVRAFERHGFVFSDRFNMDRETLVQKIKEGKKFKIGQRLTYMGNDFKTGEDIRLIEQNGENIIVAGPYQNAKDDLGNIPII